MNTRNSPFMLQDKPTKIKRYTQLFFLVAIIFFQPANLSGKSYFFSHLTPSEGLSQNDASCILQDSFGFIWIGTYDGLNRFDGHQIKHYYKEFDNHASLSSNRIKTMHEDREKRLWIGTDGDGINYVNLKNEKIFRVKTPAMYSRINDFTENAQGEIIAATSQGLLKIVEQKNLFKCEIIQNSLTGLSINKVKRTNDKKALICSTSNGIWILQNNTARKIDEAGSGYFEALAIDHKNNIWAASNQNLLKISHDSGRYQVEKVKNLAQFKIRTLLFSKDNSLFAGTQANGLLIVDPETYRIHDHYISERTNNRSILSNYILNLYIDKTNHLWLANRSGVSYSDLNSKKFKNIFIYDLIDNPGTGLIRTIYSDKNFLYFGIQQNGCYAYNLTTQNITQLYIPNKAGPNSIIKLGEKIGVLSNKGIYVLNTSTKPYSFYTYPHFPPGTNPQSLNVLSMCRDSNQNTYFGCFRGLFVHSDTRTYWLHSEYEQAQMMEDIRVYSMIFDKENNCIWIGTISEGLFRINFDSNGKFSSIESYNSSMDNSHYIPNSSIWCFFMDSKQNLWLGSDMGLMIRKAGSTSFSLIETEGILNKKILAIQEDSQGALWLSNSQGLIKFNPDNQEVIRYSYHDGLTASTFTEAVAKDGNGTLYFGTTNGINIFNPEDIKKDSHQSRLLITDFKVNNQSIKPDKSYFGSKILFRSISATDSITLNYKQNNFLFEFSSSNFSQHNKYKYKLIGHENDWQYTTSKYRFASYSNLEPGTYQMIADVASLEGIWSNNPRKFVITIIPPPWATTWAYVAYISVITGIILAFILFLQSKQKLKHKIEINSIHLQKEKEINELKLMFFTNVAHEFKTPLSLITGPLNNLNQKDISQEDFKFCFQVISRNTQRMMMLVNQLLDFRKINSDKNILKIGEHNLSFFAEEVLKAFYWQALHENIHFNIISPKNLIGYFDPDIIEKTLYNLTSNAFKNTPKNGIIEVEIKQIWIEGNTFANIMVRNSGEMIPDRDKQKIFERYFHSNDKYSSGIGLNLSYTLMKAHKGEINVSDNNFGGPEFIISFPFSKEAYTDQEITNKVKPETLNIHKIKDLSLPTNKTKTERATILIVEDDYDLRSYLNYILKTHYNVLLASNGKEGVNVATKNLPDLIISDVMMPQMDGIEMCKQLKNDERSSHIPILILTAKTDKLHQQEGLQVGAWDYITKPFDAPVFFKKIQNIVDTQNKLKHFLANQDITPEIRKHYTSYDQNLIKKTVETIKKNMNKDDFNVEYLVQELSLSRMQLHRKLKSLVGMSTTAFINSIKIKRAVEMFDQGCDRIQEAMEETGFSSYAHFNNLFKKEMGVTASGYINKSGKKKST